MTRLNSNVNEPSAKRTTITSRTNKNNNICHKKKYLKKSCTSIVPFPRKKNHEPVYSSFLIRLNFKHFFIHINRNNFSQLKQFVVKLIAIYSVILLCDINLIYTSFIYRLFIYNNLNERKYEYYVSFKFLFSY